MKTERNELSEKFAIYRKEYTPPAKVSIGSPGEKLRIVGLGIPLPHKENPMNALGKILKNAIDLLFPPRKTEVLLQNTPLQEFEALTRPRSIYGAEALLPYEDPRVRALIWELKYKDSEKASSIGGTILASYLLEALADGLVYKAIVLPVPLHTKRKQQRGYNQCERLAQAVCASLPNISVESSALVRIRNTPKQTGLKQKERLTNIKDAFVADSQLVEGRTCVLIDDVVTTGATLDEAQKTLLRAGAARVIAVALAYA